MTISLVLNDLSLRHQATDRHAARRLMREFVDTLITAVDHKVTVLRTHEDIRNIILSPNYPLDAWLGDHQVPREENLFLLDYMSRYPYIQPYDDNLQDNDELQKDQGLFEGKFKGDKADGLGFAYLMNGLALSFLSEPCWDTPWLDLDCKEMDDESHEIIEFHERQRHVSRARHISKDHAAWIEERLVSGVRNGSDLLRNAVTLFPNLVFCRDASNQIRVLGAGSMYLPSILRLLLALEKQANSWTEGDFDYRCLHNASSESESTMSRFGDKRRFVCPDGIRRTFEWHLKGLPRPWRIHICADSRQKRILIGYVGKHLPTQRDPT